jgi:hypothetical protein
MGSCSRRSKQTMMRRMDRGMTGWTTGRIQGKLHFSSRRPLQYTILVWGGTIACTMCQFSSQAGAVAASLAWAAILRYWFAALARTRNLKKRTTTGKQILELTVASRLCDWQGPNLLLTTSIIAGWLLQQHLLKYEALRDSYAESEI